MERPGPGATYRVARREVLRTGALLAGSAAATRVLGARHAAAAASAGLTKATLRLNWNPNAEHAPYYLGKKKGFYAEQGVDLTILPGSGSAVAVKLVGSGDSMFGVAVADSVTVGRAQKIPVVSLGVLLQQSPTVLGSLRAKHITKPTDLYGKKVGDNPASTVYAFWKAFQQVNHLDPGKITEVAIHSSIIAPLIAGTVDAGGVLLTNEVVVIEHKGFPLNIINYYDYGVRSYGQTLFTNESVLKGNRDLAKRMAQATFKSWTYTLDHVPEAVDALAEAVPETDKRLEAAKWPNITALVWGPDAKVNGFGHQTAAGWRQTYETFRTGGLIQDAFDPTSIFTDLAFAK